MQTQKVITELDEYLTANNCYSEVNSTEEIENINSSVNTNWQSKIEEALRIDLRTILQNNNLQVKQTRSIFEIVSVSK